MLQAGHLWDKGNDEESSKRVYRPMKIDQMYGNHGLGWSAEGNNARFQAVPKRRKNELARKEQASGNNARKM